MGLSVAHNPNIHLEPWQRQDLLVHAHLSSILIKLFLKLGDLRIRNQFRNPSKLVRAVLSRFMLKLKCVATLKGHHDNVESIAFHPTAPLLATLTEHSYWVNSVAFHSTALLWQPVAMTRLLNYGDRI